jgi:hypothetical protein
MKLVSPTQLPGRPWHHRKVAVSSLEAIYFKTAVIEGNLVTILNDVRLLKQWIVNYEPRLRGK